MSSGPGNWIVLLRGPSALSEVGTIRAGGVLFKRSTRWKYLTTQDLEYALALHSISRTGILATALQCQPTAHGLADNTAKAVEIQKPAEW